MKLVTSQQMQSLDKLAIEKYKIPSLELMEKAGLGVAQAIIKRFPKKGLVGIVAGKGNNGGDGLVCARHLAASGFNCEVHLTSAWQDFSPDARANWEKLAGLDIKVHEDADIKSLKKAVCIVDAIFGTGLSSEIKGRYRTLIELINSLNKYVVAVDIPSGLSADTGLPLGTAVKAKLTVTFGMPKIGLFLNAGQVGEIELVDIGIPAELMENEEFGFHLTEPNYFKENLKPRKLDAHKGDFGHVVVIGGSVGKIGAGLLSARGALRTGTGLVTYALPKTAYAKFDTRSPEIMYEALPDEGTGYLAKDSLKALKEILKGKSAVVLGPGIGTNPSTKAVVAEILSKANVPVVVDADALNCIAGGTLRFGKNIILTPHPGEMGRLIGKTTEEVQSDRVNIAKEFAKKYGVTLVLKGFRTVISTPGGIVYINPTGSPAMATAGAGDVLAGVIAGLIAQDIPSEISAIGGAYIHGFAGDMAAESLGQRGVIASDIIANLPKAIKILSLGSGV